MLLLNFISLLKIILGVYTMSASVTQTQGNPGLKATVEVNKPQKAEDMGRIVRMLAELTAQKQNGSLDGVNIKPIDGTLSGLLYDLVQCLAIEKRKSIESWLGNVEPLIGNGAAIIHEVLLTLGAVRANADQSAKLDDQFIKNLASNLLKVFQSHDLIKFIKNEALLEEVEAKLKNKESLLKNKDDLKKVGEELTKVRADLAKSRQELTADLKKMFEELLVCAGLDEKHIEGKPDIIRYIFYPSMWSGNGMKVRAIVLAANAKGIDLSRGSFEQMFVDTMLDMLAVQKKLSAKSKDDILTKNEGASALVDKLVVKVLDKLRNGKLSLSPKLIKKRENKTFLNTMLNKVMAKQEGAENPEIQQAWNFIDGQLKMALKAIFAVILTPKAGQDAIDFRNQLLVEIVNNFSVHKEAIKQKVDKIEAKEKEELAEDLSNVIGVIKGSLKVTGPVKDPSEIVGPLKEEAYALLCRKNISWEKEAIDFIAVAWKKKINADNATPEKLFAALNKWETEAEDNRDWSPADTEKAQALLKRYKKEWDTEVKQFLKKIEYANTARSVLGHELKSERFTDYIPSFISAENLFDQIYEYIGEVALEFHEQQKIIKEKGDEALKFIEESEKTNEIPELSTFVEELMKGAVSTVDDLAKKNQIDLAHGKFLNEMVCNLLNEDAVIPQDQAQAIESPVPSMGASGLAANGKKFAKQEAVKLIKNILMIAIKSAIDRTTKELGCKPAEAFSKLIENFVKKTQDGLSEIGKNCKDKSIEQKKKEIQDLAAKLKVDITLEDKDEKVLKQYRALLVKALSRELLENLMPKKLFDTLLLPMMRNAGLWEMITDEIVAPYIEGISETLDAFQEASKEDPKASKLDPKDMKQLKLTGDSKQLEPLIEPLTAKAIQLVTEIKFGTLLKQNGESKLGKVNFKILDEMFGKALEKGGQITNLIQLALPAIIESVLAFHLNPKDGKTSQELAVELLWMVLETAHACYGKIDAIKAEDLDLEALKEEFKGSEELNEKNKKENIEAYCKESKPKVDAATALNDKQFYIWLKINREMKAGLKAMMDKVLPEALWKRYVPQQFEELISREKVGAILLDYLKEGYAHAGKMRAMVNQGKTHLRKEDAGKAEGEDSDLQKFIEQKVIEGLQDAAKIDPADAGKPSIVWVKGVLQILLDKQDANGNKPLTQIAIQGAYAVFSKLLAGGLSSLNKAPIIANAAGDDVTLMGKVSNIVSFVRRDYHKLNELKVEQKCSDFPQINSDLVKKYLSLGDHRLKADEEIEALVDNFEMKDGSIVFKVIIKGKDPKANAAREVLIDVTQYVYWEAAFKTINEIIPDADWVQLVPELMRSLMTKETIASIAVPYIHAVRQIQEPLQKKGDASKKLVHKVAAEDPKGNLEGFIKDKIINKIDVVIQDVGNNPKKLSDSLPDAIDKLFKDLLKDTTNEHFKDIKEVVVERIVYLLLAEFFKPAVKGSSATDQTVANMTSKFSAVIQTYSASGKNANAIAQKLVDEVLPQRVWDELITGRFKDLLKDNVNRGMIVEQIEGKIKEICDTIKVVNDKQVRAMKQIRRLDQDNGLVVGRGGGLEEMLNTICKSIDETIDEYGARKDKIAEGQPLLVNELTKAAFRDPVISKVIKDSAHAMVTVCMARIFQTNPDIPGQKPQERLFEVMTGLYNAYNSADPKATATAWLKEFLPEDLRKKIVPPFLQETLTHEFLAELLLQDYVPEVKAVVDMIKAAPKEGKDDKVKNSSRLQAFVKATLGKYKDPNFSMDGMAGFGGFVKSLESLITGAIAGDKKFESMGKLLNEFLDGTIANVLAGPQVNKLLHKQFLSEAMIVALPMFGSVDVDKELPNYPKLKDDQLADLSPAGLKKIGIDLKRFAGEKDEPFKQRVINKHFELQCGKLAGEIAFPKGAADLPVPKVAQPAVFNQVEGAIGNQIGRIVNRNERILFAISFLGVDEANKKKFQEMEDHLKVIGDLSQNEKTAETMFKNALVSFVMNKIDQSYAKWPRFFAWFAAGFVKMIAKIALKLAINGQVWNLVSDPKNDPKFRHLVWKLLSFAKSYDPKDKDTKEMKEHSKDLKNAFGIGFKDMGLLGGIRSKAASAAASSILGQNFVDLIA